MMIKHNKGIYELTDEKTNFDYMQYWKKSLTKTQKSIINKLCYTNDNIDKHINVYDDTTIFVPISGIAGGRGCLPTIKDYDVFINGKYNNIYWKIVWNKDPKHQAFKKDEDNSILGISFNTKEEALNFYNSYQNFLPLKGLCKLTVQQQHIQLQALPFFSDYSKPITEEYLKKTFDLTNDEIKELNRLGSLKYNEDF